MKSTLYLFIAIMLMLGSCSDEPIVSGNRTFIVGQHVTITLDKGDKFTNQFVLKDGADNAFTVANEDLQYEFISDTQIAFRIPPGITPGSGTLEIGSSSKTYRLGITLKRGVAYTEGKGIIKIADIENGKSVLRTADCGQGFTRLKIVDNESTLVALSANEGNIYWYKMDPSEGNKLSLVIPVLAIQSGTQGVNATLKDVVAQPQGLIIATDNGIATLLVNKSGSSGTQVSFGQWIDNSADYVSLSASQPFGDSNAQTIVGAGGTSAGGSILTVFQTPPFPDNTSSKMVFTLTDQSPAVSKVSVSSDGAYAAAVIPNLGKLYLVRLSDGAQPVSSDVCPDPVNVEFVADDQKLAVLCRSDNLIELYDVAGTTANLSKTIPVGLDTNKVQYMYKAQSGLIYVLTDQGMKVLDPASSNPMPAEIPGFGGLSVSSFVVQP